MKILELLKGKKVNVMTDAKVVVQLEVVTAEEKPHSEDLEPSSEKNDYWPKSRDWTTIEVTFTNGFRKTYKSVNDIELVD